MPFYILLNLAVDSGQFGGDVNRATFHDDINMYVDYVRAYQKTKGYAESVDRTASDNAKTDWDEYEGVNQIADVTASSLDANGFASDNDSDASKWYLSYNANNTGGKATLDSFKDDSGKTWAKVGISEAGSQDYSVQLIGHYNAKAGIRYRLMHMQMEIWLENLLIRILKSGPVGVQTAFSPMNCLRHLSMWHSHLSRSRISKNAVLSSIWDQKQPAMYIFQM